MHRGESVLDFSVMPGLVPGIHVLLSHRVKDVDGRDKPGHDEEALVVPMLRQRQPEHLRQILYLLR